MANSQILSLAKLEFLSNDLTSLFNYSDIKFEEAGRCRQIGNV